MRLTPYVFVPLVLMALCSDFLARYGFEERWIFPLSVLLTIYSITVVVFGLGIIRALNQEIDESSQVQQALTKVQAREKVLDMLITRIDDLKRQRETLEDRRN